MKKIYIDESGNLGEKGTKYLVFAAIIIEENNEIKLKKKIKNIKRNRFKNELKKSNELKASSSSEELKRNFLTILNKIECDYEILVVNKKNIKKFGKNKHEIYDYLAGVLIKKIVFNTNFEILIDRSKSKVSLQIAFNERIKKLINSKHKVKIFHAFSQDHIGLQIADLVAWSFFQKYEHGNTNFSNKINKIEKCI